jgi:hypothetical protein
MAPTAAKILRFSYFLSRCTEAIQQRPTFYDCGTAIKLREYCLAGGHSWDDMFYETGNIPVAISKFKKYGGDIDKAVAGSSGSRYKTSPRRQLDTMIRGFMHEKSWDDDITSFGTPEDQVRTTDIDLGLLEQMCSEKLEQWLQEMIERSIGTIHTNTYREKRKTVDTALKMLGLPSLLAIQKSNKKAFEDKSGMRVDLNLIEAIIDPELSEQIA